MYFLHKFGIFHCHVSLPEGNIPVRFSRWHLEVATGSIHRNLHRLPVAGLWMWKWCIGPRGIEAILGVIGWEGSVSAEVGSQISDNMIS